MLSGLLVLALVGTTTVDVFAQEKKDAEKPLKQIIDELGPEVMVFTEPKRADGTIDYIAALNRKYSEGVTRDNNAFRDLYVLFDHSYEDGWQENVEGMLDALELDEAALRRGPHLFALDDYLSDQGYDFDRLDAFDERQKADRIAASQEEDVQAWLKQSRPVLEQALAAADKPRYWTPLVGGDEPGTVIAVLLPSLGEHRMLARSLQVWVYDLASRGKHDKAVQVLGAIRRLAWHESHGPTLIHALVAVSIDALAAQTLKELLAAQLLPEEALATISAQWSNRPPRVPISESIAFGEKSMVMDAFLQIVTGRLGDEEDLLGGGGAMMALVKNGSFDLARALKRISREYDQVIRISRVENYKLRQRLQAIQEKHLEEIIADTRSKLVVEVGDAQIPNILAAMSKDHRTDALSTLFISILMPALGAASNTETRQLATERCATTAIACECYRLRHGKLPDKLDDLVPTYLDAVPADPFNEKKIVYKQTDTGFMLYTVGANLQDNGGEEREQRDEGDWVYEISWRGE